MTPLSKHSVRILLLWQGLLFAISSNAQFTDYLKGGANDGVGSATNGTCVAPINVVIGGGFDGATSVVSSNCAAPINVVTGGANDGASAIIGSGCASPSNVVAGGAFDGVGSVISNNCATPVNVVSGGAFDGASAVVGGGCAAPSNVVAGGGFDGVGSVMSSICATPVNVVTGGAFDGASAVVGGGCAAPSNVVAGGGFDGVGSVISSICAAPVNVVSGGTFDGTSAVIGGGCATPSNVVAGGGFDGVSSAIISNCAAPINVVTGGSFDGVSSTRIGTCASLANVVKGGSFDGAAYRLLACDVVNIAQLNTINATCGLCNGSATAYVNGGFTPYNYTWSSGATSSGVTGLCAGSYSLTVTDAASSTSTRTVTISSSGTALALIFSSITNVSCNSGNNGSLTLSASGGTLPYTFSWSNGASSYSINSLQAGSYSITVTEASGCSSATSATLTQPTALIASCSGTNVTCSGSGNGSASATASGGTPSYTYLWSNGRTQLQISNLQPQPYSVTITDSRGCIASCSYNVTGPSTLVASSTSTAIHCNGQAATITVSASGGTTPYSGTGNFSRGPGSYTFIVTDNHGCTAASSVVITQPTALSVSATSNSPVCSNNNINITSLVSGGVAGYRYSWTGPSNFSSTVANPVITSSVTAQTGTYSLIVTDANNCTALAITYVQVDNCFTTLALNLYIQGYYQGSGLMRSVMLNENVPGSTVGQTDTITVVLRDAVVPTTTIDSAVTILMRNGTAMITFSPSVAGHSYYIVVKHRNSLQTWSKTQVLFSSNTSYSFTTANSTAYGDNQVQVDFGPIRWAIYTGDINQDENIDLIDFPTLDIGINNGLTGYYKSDLNGDGNVDLIDFPVMDANINLGVFSRHP